MYKTRSIVISLCLIMLAVSIHSYWKRSSRSPDSPEVLFGIPVYPEAKLNIPLSGTGSPRIFVYLTDDSLDQVLAFYTEAFKAEPIVLSYGKTSMTVYQYLIKPSDITNYPLKGVEVMPYNAFYRRILKKSVKIKIYVPEEEIGDSETPLD